MDHRRVSIAGLEAMEQQRMAAGLNQRLIDSGLVATAISDWWNLVGWPELDGKTATAAWLEGRQDEVRSLIERLTELSADRAEIRLKDEGFVANLEQRLVALSNNT